MKGMLWSRAALLVAASLAACIEDSVAPASETKPPAEPRALGFVELTFTGIGTPELASSIITAPTLAELEARRAERERSGDLRDIVTQDLKFPRDSAGGGNGTIQLRRVDPPQQFVHDSVRYMHATYEVRNAQSNGAFYNTERRNLTFLAVSTNGAAYDLTAIHTLELPGGTPAPSSLALEVLPTDLVETDGTSVTAAHPDVLQIIRESEQRAVPPPSGVRTVFPWGFVVRRIGAAGNTSRTLPASPPEGTFDGIVDFAFSIPQQPNAADNPDKLSVLMLAVDDSETRLTQGPQEQSPANQDTLEHLAASLGADTVTLLPGGSAAGPFGVRTLCSVRTAGFSTSPHAYLVHADWTNASFSPSPSTLIPPTTAFQATFSTPVFGIGPNSFTVTGLHSGPAFQDTTYTGNGTTTITTPQGKFFPGEEVNIALTGPCPQAQVAHYRVQAQGSGTFVPAPGSPQIVDNWELTYVALADFTGNDTLDAVALDIEGFAGLRPGNGNGSWGGDINRGIEVVDFPNSVAIGDLNGDGILDLAVGSNGAASDSISIHLGEGGLNFQPHPGVNVGGTPRAVAIGDLDGKNGLDIAVANQNSGKVFVVLNQGHGTFARFDNPRYSVVDQPVSIAIGELDGQNGPDIAVAGSGSVSILLNNGNGTFPQTNPSYHAGGAASLAIADLDGTNGLDIAVASGSNYVSVLLNQGSGTFPQTNPRYGSGSSTRSIAIGDLTGDGRLDLAVANHFADSVSVLLNHGNGTFPQTNPNYGAGREPIAVAIGDVDGNGILDLVAANSVRPGTLFVLLGQAP